MNDPNTDRTPGPSGEPWFMRDDFTGTEPDWQAEGFVHVQASAAPDEEDEPDQYHLRGLLYMIAAGVFAYAACSTFGNFADAIASALAGSGLSQLQAHAISASIVLGSISAVTTTLVLLWSWLTFKGGFRRFFIDNEEWLERFAEGGKPHGRVHTDAK